MRDRFASGTSLSFLDVIACAFGAIVLLVLILPVGDQGVPATVSNMARTLGQLLFNVEAVEEQISTIQHQIDENQGIVDRLSTEVASQNQNVQLLLSTVQSTINETREIEGRTEIVTQATTVINEATGEIEEEKAVATDLAGIPVDADHVAFVIDNSGSMKMISSRVSAVIADILDIYPELKGIQILNDQGHYMERSGRWIPDTKATRLRLRNRFSSFNAFSSSNPAPGIRTAISDLYKDGIDMAVFVLGDDYASSNIASFTDDIDRLLELRKSHGGTIRIHAVGFPNLNELGLGQFTVMSPLNYVVVMQELTRRYDGVFVGLDADARRILNPIQILQQYVGGIR